MACKVKKTRTGFLAFRLFWNGMRSWEGTALKDTPENRRLVEAKALLISSEIKAGTFDYLAHFPGGNKARYLRENFEQSIAADLQWLEQLADRHRGTLEQYESIHGVKTYVAFFPAMKAFKIGRTNKLSSRLSQLKVGIPDGRLWLVACLAGDSEFELHARFSKYHQHGDWFGWNADLLQFVRSINSGSNPA